MNLATWPSNRATSPATAFWWARSSSSISSGSSRCDSSVEPTRSANMTVSCRRSAERQARARPGRAARPRRRTAPRSPRSSSRRWPTEVTPISFRSSAVRPGQDPRVDVVVAERLLVLAQAQPAQPSPDVHPRAPDRACLPGWMQSIPNRRSASWNGSSEAPSRRRSPARWRPHPLGDGADDRPAAGFDGHPLDPHHLRPALAAVPVQGLEQGGVGAGELGTVLQVHLAAGQFLPIPMARTRNSGRSLGAFSAQA